MIRTIIIFMSLIFTFLSSNAQVRVETQLGGSNYLGMTVNSVYDISLSSNKNHHLSPGFGVGMLILDSYFPTSIIKFGLNYRFRNWGIGAEVSGFSKNPFFAKQADYYPDMLLYTYINYMLPIKESWYINFSVGYSVEFEKYYKDYTKEKVLGMTDTVFLWWGLSFGYKF